MINRAWSKFEIKSVSDDKRVLTGIASTPSTDRAGDIVEPMGAKFSLPLPFLWQHDSDQPIGHVTSAKPNRNGIPIEVQLVKIDEPGTLKERLDNAWQSIKSGLVKGLSIGFSPLEYSFLDGGGIHFTKISLHEISAVTLPCNQDASIVSIKSADRGSRAADERLRDVLKRFARKHGLPANAQHMFGVVGGGMEGLIKTDLDLARRIERLERIEARGKRVKDVEYSQSPSGTFIFRKTIFEDGTSDVRVLTR